eukprot:TRINITY_DN30400_c0_g1_i1.p1 TRINITY_DN30400_c0_g1~~TRINITY_DN30400_c0_g1_i1.p1  ORF type:complete len:349 (+),score=64.39 TRINITY_DN30400_c0_g1_i1:146-1048(+)
MIEYGKDIFFLKSAVGGHIQEGAHVRFSVKMDFNGPVATDIEVPGVPTAVAGAALPPLAFSQPTVLASHPALAHAGYAALGCGGPVVMARGPVVGGSQALMSAYGLVPQHPATASTAPRLPGKEQVFLGHVKSYNEEKGWGHISCEALHKVFNKDLFLMSGQLNGQVVTAGTLVSFKVSEGKQGPLAVEVSVIPPDAIGSEAVPGRRFVGTVKAFNVDKGWGFLTSADVQAFGKDVFFHKRELGDSDHTPANGEEFSFTVEVDSKGLPVAKGVAFLGGLDAGYGAAPTAASPEGNRAQPY